MLVSSASEVVHITNPGVCSSFSCHTCCIRFSCAISGASRDQPWHSRSLSGPLTRGNEVSIGGKLDGKVAHVQSPAIPLKLETEVLLTNAI
jgi:hypothetical protein